MRQDYMDTGAEGPASLYPAYPQRHDVPRGLDGLGEDGLDVGPIENGYIVSVLNESGDEYTLVGPFRSATEAEREADDIRTNMPEVDPFNITVVPLWRPFAVPGVALRATEAEEERYNALMAKDPAERSAEEEDFVEVIGDLLVAELAEED